MTWAHREQWWVFGVRGRDQGLPVAFLHRKVLCLERQAWRPVYFRCRVWL